MWLIVRVLVRVIVFRFPILMGMSGSFVGVLVFVRIILLVYVRGPRVNSEVNAFDILTPLPVEVHVKITEIELR